MTGIDDSRLPEREPQLYETLHNLEIPNLAVTVVFYFDLFNIFYFKIKNFRPSQVLILQSIVHQLQLLEDD